MSAHSTLDRESFQNLLASAFVVQESLMDAQSGSALVELLHVVMAGELDVNGATHLIVERARNVANATGVAIGLLKGDQLVYRAGSGSAATLVGRHVMATLSVSANAEARREILCVEDARNDPGIGAAICRQFGARSLLILPIYHNRSLAGVLEVFFSEAHAFQDHEVCTYELMARVVGEAMAHAVLLEQKKALTAEQRSTIPQANGQTPNQMQRFTSDSGSRANKHVVCDASGAAVGEVEKLPLRGASSAGAATMITHRAKRVPSHMRLWRIADRAAVAIVLVTASWIAYTYRGPTSPMGASPRQRSNVLEQQAPFVPQKLVPVISKPQTASVPIEEGKKVARRTPQRVRVGDNEIDYVSEDVTVRHFISKPALQQVRVGDYLIDYISDDVTVRHFTPKLAVVPLK
jgi:putative methionine-R-sulfoxide reductase with GAF domain